MILFTLTVIAQLVLSKGNIGYALWAGIFAAQWMKFLAFSVIVALAWHAWVGAASGWTTSSRPELVGAAGFHDCLARRLRRLGFAFCGVFERRPHTEKQG